MTDERWKIVDASFSLALDIEPEQRAVWLDELGQRDPLLRSEVERLLRLEERAAHFLARPDVAAIDSGVSARSDQNPGQFGPYRVIRSIGVGGMGEVFLAERADGQFEQRVAIKQLAYPTPGLLERFRRERQILARLEHPNIARLLDGGLDSAGAPYFVMEFVDGSTLLEYADERGLDIRARLALMLDVCAAVQYAHQNLIVHRDLKPSNIMVAKDGTPKLLDFGIAKMLETAQSEATLTLGRVLTPGYAAPEQIRGDPLTTATDVFALGVVLYELFTGARPYRPRDYHKSGAETRYADPTPPSFALDRNASDFASRRRSLRGDLDHVVLTAIASSPEKRYASVAALAADMENVLAARPISARRDRTLYVLGRFAARNRLAMVAAALVIVVTLLGIFAVLEEAHRANRQARRAESEARTSIAVKNFLAGVFKAASPDQALGSKATAVDLMQAGSRRVATELAGQPAVQAELLAELGSIDLELAENVAAGALSRQGLAAARGVLDPAGAVVGRLRVNLALSLRETDEVDKDATEATRLLESVLAAESTFPVERRELSVAALIAEGRIELDRDEFTSSETHLRKAVELARARGRSSDIDRSDALEFLGRTLSFAGRRGESIPIQREAIALRERYSDARDPELLDMRRVLGDTLQAIGQTAEAESLLRDVLEKDREVLGESHPNYAATLLALLNTEINARNFDAAERIAKQILPVWERVGGKDSDNYQSALNAVALLKYEQGDYVAAIAYQRESLGIAERRHGAKGAGALMSRHNLAAFNYQLGNLDEADRDFRELVAIRRAQGTALAMDLNFVGTIARLKGHPQEAKEIHEEGLADMQKREPSDSVGTLQTRLGIARDERNLGELDAARAEAMQILADGKASPSHDTPELQAARFVIAQLDYLEGNCGRALPVFASLQPRGDTVRKYWRASEVDLMIGLCTSALGTGSAVATHSLIDRSMTRMADQPTHDPFFMGLAAHPVAQKHVDHND